MESESQTVVLANFAATLRWSAVPEDLQTLLPIYMLDTASAMLCGVAQPVYQAAVRMTNVAYGIGAQPGAVAAVDGTRTSLSGAAFLNGVSAGCFEFEHVISTAHPASAMFAALLTVAAAYHKTGEELLTAMAVGYELCTRIGFACTKGVEEERGFHNPGLNGHLATAAAVCNLMALDTATTASAMGIAASSSAGLMAFVNSGAMTKRLHPARSGQLGVEAAFLAREGVVGPPDILENPRGFLRAFSPDPKAEFLTSNLGREWLSKRMMLKLSPVHMVAQALVHAINDLRNKGEATWTAEAIQAVTVTGGPNALRPTHMIQLPQSLVSAQYSVPFSIASALTVDLRDPMQMSDGLLFNPLTRKISQNMKFVVDNTCTNSITGHIVIRCADQDINVDATNYPGINGSQGFVEAAIDKFERVIASLGVATQGARLRSVIEAVPTLKDASDVVDALVEAGSQARSTAMSTSH